MNIQAFISYSHLDDLYREQLEKHLSGLKANGVLTAWTDRRIEPGQDWEKEIDENLAKSQLVLLLVSSDFLSSGYCTGIEMKKALDMGEKNNAIVVPIILRPCDWEDYLIGKLNALPRFAKPISTSENQDQAWLNVVLELKTLLSVNQEKALSPSSKSTARILRLSNHCQKWLNDTEIELVHRHVDQVLLSDIFVPPDLKKRQADINLISQTVNSRDATVIAKNCVIFGDEQSGKTALSKHYFYESVRLQANGTDVLPG